MPENNSPHDIFISYSRKNKDVVLPIKEEIERTLGLRCWIDLSDIPCGSENFKRKVIPGIRQTRIAFLFFLSAESQASEFAMKEINFAKKRANKRLILIRINDDDMTDEFAFDFQDTDIIDWRETEQKAKLFRDLRIWADAVDESHEMRSPAVVPTYSTGYSSYASAWRLVPRTFMSNEGVAFSAKWDGLLEAFWKAWRLKTEDLRRSAVQLVLAADRHDPEIQYRIGLMLLLGWFGDDQRNGARAWLEVAAENDHYMAMLEIGNCFENASCGFVQNHTIAQQWYDKSFESMKRAASKGDGRAMFNAGRFCRWPEFFGVARPQEGIEWWNMSAKLGNFLAQSWLAREYRSGEYVPKNLNKSVSLYVDSAIGGSVNAMAKMGKFCKEGVPGVMGVSLRDALKWYQAAQEHAKPQSYKVEIDELLKQI